MGGLWDFWWDFMKLGNYLSTKPIIESYIQVKIPTFAVDNRVNNYLTCVHI